MLRRVLLVVGVVSVVAGVLCLPVDAHAAHWMIGEGAVLVLLLVFERWRYAPKRPAGGGQWQPTGERFVDPSSGKVVDVYFDPETGERDYREQDARP